MGFVIPFPQAPREPAFRPRRTRMQVLGILAYQHALAAGGKTLEAACAQIDAEFSNAYAHNERKLYIERAIKLGTGHPKVQARYRKLILRLWGYTLDTGILLVDAWYSEPGRPDREALGELRIMLRMLRRDRMAPHYQGLLRTFLGHTPTIAQLVRTWSER